MAGVFHVSEAEAARDFAALMRRVRAGDAVVVDDAQGGALAVMRPAVSGSERPSEVTEMPGKTAEEVIEGFRRWEAENGPLVMDEDFVKDMEEIRKANRPGARPAERTIDQAMALVEGQRTESFSPRDDPEFAEDMKAVRAIYNAPLDHSKWD